MDEPGPSIALTALRGMEGIGKTILAQALSHDEVVQQAFPDGIAWTTVGKDVGTNLKARMQQVRRALGGHTDAAETEDQCISLYRTLLQDKHALVIVDDIWRIADIEPFLAEPRRSRLLLQRGTEQLLLRRGLSSRDRLKVSDLETGSALRTLEGHSLRVTGVAVTGTASGPFPRLRTVR